MKILKNISFLLIMSACFFSGCGGTKSKNVYMLSETSYVDLAKVARLQGIIEFANRSFPLNENGISGAIQFIREKSRGDQMGGALLLVSVKFDTYTHILYQGEDIYFPNDNGPSPEQIQKIQEGATEALEEFREITNRWRQH